jgi:hypothetical protein
LYTYGVHVRVIVLILVVGRVAVVKVERPSAGGLEIAQPEPSLDEIISHWCEDPIEVMLQL